MKKIICLFAFVTVLVTCSCSNNYYYNESQVPNNVVASENEIETVKQLQIYNDSLKETTSVKFTRGWGTIWSVAAADGLAFINSFLPLVKAGRRILALTGGSGLYWVAGGVFLGTVFMTGGASYGAYQSAHNG